MTLVPVRLIGKHEGLIVMHTPAEYAALWKGVDREAALILGAPSEPRKDEG